MNRKQAQNIPATAAPAAVAEATPEDVAGFDLTLEAVSLDPVLAKLREPENFVAFQVWLGWRRGEYGLGPPPEGPS